MVAREQLVKLVLKAELEALVPLVALDQTEELVRNNTSSTLDFQEQVVFFGNLDGLIVSLNFYKPLIYRMNSKTLVVNFARK